MEIRLHGRGGQGGVTCAKILAAFHARLGKSVQTFGDYAGERTGAPVRAFTRVSDRPITNRNKVYEPDQLLVLDETLLGKQTILGLVPGGLLLVNSSRGAQAVAEEHHGFSVGAVDATAIARRHKIGTKSVIIVNTTIAGAYARMVGIDLSTVEETYRSLGFHSNFAAAKEAYEGLQLQDALDSPEQASTPAARPPVLSLEAHESSPPLGSKTGAWRTQTPNYTTGIAPCSLFCPAGNDVIGFVQKAAREGVEAAAKVLAETTSLPGVCGRVCPAPCMEACNRIEYDGAVDIRSIERWIADHGEVARPKIASGEAPKKFAVVGGGPAGLSAADLLARRGHEVTLYDAEESLGGVLRTGIPSYRLPRDVLDKEVDRILALGMKTVLGTRITKEKITELAADHAAVIVATGLQKLRGLSIPGAELSGVDQGIDVLRQWNDAEARWTQSQSSEARSDHRERSWVDGPSGTQSQASEARSDHQERSWVDGLCPSGTQSLGHVVVLGGGNTAIDCARSALRLGAKAVTVAYRRTAKEMPAIREEIESAEEEGIQFRFQRQPVQALGDKTIARLVLAKVVMGEPDESGRRSPIVTEETEEIACDRVLLALGQSVDGSLLPKDWSLREGRIHKGDRPLNLFAAGDFSTWEGTVTHAIGDGRRAAQRALRSLGVEVEVFERPDKTRAVPATDIRFDHFERTSPHPVRYLDRSDRMSFDEVSLGLEEAKQEAERCFSCGHCTECDTCLVYCPEGIVRRRTVGYDIDYSYCKGCGICVAECPRCAMEMECPSS